MRDIHSATLFVCLPVSVVCVIAPVGGVRIVKPVDIVHEFVSLCSKADGLDVQVLKAEAVWAHSQVLRLNGQELWVQPCTEHLTVEGLPPLHMMVVVRILQLNCGDVGFDLADVEEHVIDLVVSVRVGST